MLAPAFLVALGCLQAGPPGVVPEVDLSLAQHTYHAGEQWTAGVVAGAGALSLAGGAGLMSVDDDLARGLGASMAVIGGLGAVGFGAYVLAIPGMVDSLDEKLAADSANTADDEAMRLTMVIDRFVWLRLIEGGVATTALVAAGIGAGSRNNVVTGAGLGVAGWAMGLFIYDSLAADRAHAYRDVVESY